jgi:hypothetical protein
MRPSLLLLSLATLCGCAATRPPAPTAALAASRTARAARHTITARELGRYEGRSAYDAVAFLRPEFLRARGPVSLVDRDAHEPVVYLEGTRLGGLEALRQIRSDETREIRWLSGPDATIRYGRGHGGGAIIVLLGSPR